MTAPTSIRRATRGDEARILDLMSGFCQSEGKTFDRDLARAGLVPLLKSDKHGTVLVAEHDNGLAAYAVICWSWSVEIGGPEACLDEIYVAKRGQGIGSTLISAVRDSCVAHGMRRIFLETESVNERARQLYGRHGYEQEDSIWMALTL